MPKTGVVTHDTAHYKWPSFIDSFSHFLRDTSDDLSGPISVRVTRFRESHENGQMTHVLDIVHI